ncbi:unnamed protein product [Rotaria sordida]|uniref:Uncharacterized protein n=1 Tax=Rotaria sordida TaxID=392033 RepID=A0A818NLL3_9BILA|nr:unnamed protein product [Rotaria sordida]CAF1263168.1 unnamed protein product [Rotaria sordida]CAF3607099.1 unnamed protein product [Rotaria sordida]
MPHQPPPKDKKEFRSLVLHLKKLHPSWKAKEITRFVLQSENPPYYTTTKSLWLKVWRILRRNKVNDLPRPGAPRTTTTNRYIRAVKEAIQLKKGGKLYKWNNVLNTDFSGTFTLTPHYNQHNEGVYAKSSDDILYNLKAKPKEKFQKSVMLWDGISYQGLFPKESPIFLDEWLESIRSKGDDHHKKMYFTGERYAKFIRTIVAEKAAEEFSVLRNVIFQDDQDRKQRMQVSLDAVKHVFTNRIGPRNCATKLSDVWGALKEKLRGREYNNIEQLKNDIKKERNKFSVLLCQKIMDNIPARLKSVINQGGNQLRGH